jgi:rubrerythrin
MMGMRERHNVRHNVPPIAREASSMTDPDQIIDILRKAYQIEVDGYTFYSMTADRADKPAVQELFGKLAQDEVQHQAFLRSVLKNYHDTGVGAFSMGIVLPDFRAFSNKVFTDRFREQAEGAAFEMAAVSVGMMLEKNAVAYFSEAVRSAAEAEVRRFYQFLADWEQQHLNALQSLNETIRGDFWEKSGFSPF